MQVVVAAACILVLYYVLLCMYCACMKVYCYMYVSSKVIKFVLRPCFLVIVLLLNKGKVS